MKNKTQSASTTRLGLCCIFLEQPIKFRNTTVTAIGKMDRDAARAKLSNLCMANAEALQASLQFCAENGIGCFRINSQILPVKTHVECGYDLPDLPDGDAIIQRFKACGKFAKRHKLRTCFHPDQFVVLNSPRPDVVERSIEELEYQSEVAEWVGADVVNIHGGGAYGDKPDALARFARNLSRLSDRARSRLTVENDDTTYTPSDLLPLCRTEGIPLVYDVHHHRCNQDDLSVEEATKQAIATWDREPMFHISSPLEGWKGPKPRRHHDFIRMRDFPQCWNGLLKSRMNAMTNSLQQQFAQQHFANDYQLVNGVEMHAENPDNFQIPHPVLKKHVGVGHFVELRIDSPRFSVHDDAVERCYCPTCNGEATKPILGHEHPASLVPIPKQDVPSRGWGEDFWVQVTERDGEFFVGVVDNPLYEARLHELNQGDEVYFQEDHILAVHGSHRQEIVLGMDAVDLKTLAEWLGTQKK